MKMKSLYYLLLFLLVVSCGKNKRPGLSDKELFAQKETTDTIKQSTNNSDTATYVVPPGIKFKESRAIDPANPPVVLDIANRKLNIKKFNLGDYYSKVRYVKLKHPMPVTEGNFLFDANYYITMENGSMSGDGLCSQFIFMKDSIIAGDVFFGYYSYDNDGKFLHTIKTYDFSKVYDDVQNKISYNYDDYKRAMKNGSTNKNNNRFRVNDETMASYVYNRRDTTSNDFLFTFDLKGDTLCRFRNYNPKYDPGKKRLPISWNDPPNIYFYKGIPTVRQSMNDTVYRIIAPNQLTPAYILKLGAYKLDIDLAEDFSNKFFPDKWEETDKYVLFTYNKDRDFPNNRAKGNVKFFYSYYDKKNHQFYHFSEGTTMPDDQFFMENPLPDGLPFILSYVDISDNQLRVFYSKKRLENIIKNKQFASLSPEIQNKLKTIQNELSESEVIIMILE